MFKKIISLSLLLWFLAGAGPAAFAQGTDADYEKFVKENSLYAKVVNFLRVEQKQNITSKVEAKDLIIIYAADFVFSAFCLWLAIVIMTGVKIFQFKQYFWFAVAFTIGWFFILLLFKMTWGMLDFLVLKFRPDFKNSLIDFFSITLLVMAALICIWLTARTFELGFMGALSVFFISNVIYFVILFIVTRVMPQNDYYTQLVRFHLGAGPSIRAYLTDLYKIVTHNNLLELVRLRFYHF